MKKIVFCFDGTWNKLDAKHPTNVVLIAQSVTSSVKIGDEIVAQVTFYDEGVGTKKGESIRGGLLGKGLLQNLSDAYRFLIFNYNIGDEVHVFGFSRGAYTARSFVGLIRNCGILTRFEADKAGQAIKLYKSRSPKDHPNSEKMNDFRHKFGQPICVSPKEDKWKSENIEGYQLGDHQLFKIKYVGIWDTVGSLGVPSSIPGASWINRKYQFHDTNLTSFVENARHAISIDEQRNSFSPALWSNFKELNQKVEKPSDDDNAPYQQKWFPGTHVSIGGGGIRRELSDETMIWISDGAINSGLDLDRSPASVLFGLKPDYRGYLESYVPPSSPFSYEWITYKFMSKLPKSYRKPGPLALYETSISTQKRWKEDPKNLKDGVLYRPKTLENISDELDNLEI